MSKNVKMLFALLATAAVMVGVSFAKDITTYEELTDGAASADFVLSKDFDFLADSADDTILEEASYDQPVTLDLHGHHIAASTDWGDDTSSDIALLQAVSMDFMITNTVSADSKDAYISMDKPLYGSNDKKVLKSNIALDEVAYVNNGTAAMFIGNASYDVVNVLFSHSYVKAPKLLSGDKGYKFNVTDGTLVVASLDGISKDNLTVEAGVMFSDGYIQTILSGDKNYKAVKGQSSDWYVIEEINDATVTTSGELKDALDVDITKNIIVSNNITVTESLDVKAEKNLDLATYTISLDNAGFKLADGAKFTIQNGAITVVSGDEYMFNLGEGAELMISGDVKLYSEAMNYIAGSGVTFIEGAQLWFSSKADAGEFEESFLKANEQHLEFVAPAANNALSGVAVAEEEGYYKVTANAEPKHDGSSVGCNAGFAALALLALAFIPAKKKK